MVDKTFSKVTLHCFAAIFGTRRVAVRAGYKNLKNILENFCIFDTEFEYLGLNSTDWRLQSSSSVHFNMHFLKNPSNIPFNRIVQLNTSNNLTITVPRDN